MTCVPEIPFSNLLMVFLRSSGHVTEYYIKLGHDCFRPLPLQVLFTVTQSFSAVIAVNGNAVTRKALILGFTVEVYLQSFLVYGG
jgi:hypothetical protein